MDCRSSEKGQAIQKVHLADVFSEESAISTAYKSTSVPCGLVAASCPWLADIYHQMQHKPPAAHHCVKFSSTDLSGTC